MPAHEGFHATNGWYFLRLDDGRVRLRAPDSLGGGASQVVELDPESWASVVASVSARSETGETYRAALAFHNASDPAKADA